jgi:GNAT superfamily N-acetyltransferase
VSHSTRPARPSAATAAGGLAFPLFDTYPPPSRRCTSLRARRKKPVTVNYGAMNETLQVRRADADDLRLILGMIDEAATWLQSKDTDQWAKPWPTEAARDARVRRGLLRGKTWIAEEHGTPIATITYRQHGNQALWTERERREPAVYVSRLIVTRNAAGLGIGAAMIDWAGQRAARDWGTQWIRIDVWTTNEALRDYYTKRGFRFRRICPFDKETYPSAALFQKSISEVDADAAAARFTEVPGRRPD